MGFGCGFGCGLWLWVRLWVWLWVRLWVRLWVGSWVWLRVGSWVWVWVRFRVRVGVGARVGVRVRGLGVGSSCSYRRRPNRPCQALSQRRRLPPRERGLPRCVAPRVSHCKPSRGARVGALRRAARTQSAPPPPPRGERDRGEEASGRIVQANEDVISR